MERFDWHGGEMARETPITNAYRNTQNVRRFFRAECGDAFKFNGSFIAWLKDGTPKAMGAAADEWLRRDASKRYLSLSSIEPTKHGDQAAAGGTFQADLS